MKTKSLLLAILVLACLTAPVQAQSNWVDDFLRKYQPSRETAPAPGASSTLIRFVQTGELPVTLTDVVNLMLDKNLDIRSNRLTPRSSYFQSLVFHRVLQPSLSFSGSVNPDWRQYCPNTMTLVALTAERKVQTKS